MTKEDIIRMAREAGFADGVVDIVGAEGFANFAALVAAAERAACAKVCEEWFTPNLGTEIAAAIRARNNT